MPSPKLKQSAMPANARLLPERLRRSATRLARGIALLALSAGCSAGSGGSDLPGDPTPEGVRFESLAPYKATGVFAGDVETFPLGVWLESVEAQHDVDTDQEAGLNLYVGLTTPSDPALAGGAGMRFLAQQDEWLAKDSSVVQGWFLADELDMQLPASQAFRALSSIQAGLPKDGRDRYVNYGKGVAFWNTDAEAGRFVNEYADIVSADTYWFTDRNICGQHEGGAMLTGASRVLTAKECHRAANYGATIERLRKLDATDGELKPIWAFIEVGHPFSENDWPSIQPEEITAAVWHSIIGGAQGVIYFNHSFGGSCLSQHALREPCYSAQRAAVTAVNQQVASLAPVLNSDTAIGYAKASGVKTLAKRWNGDWYLFAGSDGTTGTRTFTIAQGTKVEALGEARTLPIIDNTFTDTYPTPNTTHIYRITG